MNIQNTNFKTLIKVSQRHVNCRWGATFLTKR